MEIFFEEINHIGCISISGRIDASNFKEVDQAFVQYFKENKNIIIDLKNVSFMDSTGLGSIVTCLKYSNEHGGVLKLTGIESKVKVVFTITKANRIFDIYPDIESTLKSYNS